MFALFTQLLVGEGHWSGLDNIAQHGQTMLVPVLFAGAVVCGLWRAAPRTWRAIRRHRPDGYLAVTILIVALAALGQWLAAAACSSLLAVWLAVKHA